MSETYDCARCIYDRRPDGDADSDQVLEWDLRRLLCERFRHTESRRSRLRRRNPLRDGVRVAHLD